MYPWKSLRRNINYTMEAESNAELAFLGTLLKPNNGRFLFWHIGSLH